ncbi:MFS transporter [Lachnoclostridium sp.]|uniref:MFS transporter n=1 Tax=Lachnoclostridium sp. TaxID=2028282 RepID=UPI0028A2C4BA|nr:MFS transporter [Lachnoclostridium sp.]
MSEKASNRNQNSYVEKISTFEKVAYGGGDLASNFVLVLTSTFVIFFYTDALGLSAGIIGAIMLFSRFADGITDIIMGYVMDKTRSKHGKARPWLLWLAIPIGISTILVFLVPNLGDVGKYIYIAITYNLVTTFLYTMINIPYGAMTSLMSRDQNQRMIINIFRMFMAQVGALVINACTLPLVNAMGGSAHQKSWVIVSIIYGVIATALFLLCFAKTKERVAIQNDKSKKLSFGTSFKLILKNNYWLLLVGIWVSMVLGMSMSMSVGTYYAKYILGNENYAGFLGALGIVPILIIIPLTAPLNKKYGKRNVALVGSFISILGQSLMLINPGSATWLMVCTVIKGVGSATLSGTMFAMIADTIEYGHWKTGTRVEGMLYSSTTFGAKVGAGVGGAVALAIIGAAGYNGFAAVQTPSAVKAIKVLYLVVPIPFMLIIPILYGLYKLDKIYPKVIEELRQREEGQQKAM